MAGTSSRTATASSRGGVGRKLQAKPRPEEHEPPRVLPWEICPPAERLAVSRDAAMGGQKSAEAVVVAAQGDEGPNTREPIS